MVIVDTCSMVAFFEQAQTPDVPAIHDAIRRKNLWMCPIVVTELLSAVEQPESLEGLLAHIPRLSFQNGFWERAAMLRRKLLAKGYKSHLADALIAQSCIDHDATLITRDRDFRHYVELGGLKVA